MTHINKRFIKAISDGVEGTPEMTEEEKKAEEEKRRIADEKFKAHQARMEYEYSPAGQIEILQKEAAEKLNKAERIKKLKELYPDLKRRVGRWDKEAFYSKSANFKVTRFDMRHNCGCCQDSPLEVWPYVETEYGNVYSDPPEFRVGQKHWITGDEPSHGWKDKLREASIPEDIIGAISMHFKRCVEDRKKCVESDDCEDDDE